VFEKIQGLTPERAAQLTDLVQQCQLLLDHHDGMDAVQRLLHDLGAGVIESILVTRELLGTGPGRTDALRTHHQLVDTLERAQDIVDAARNLPRTQNTTTLIAIDGSGGSGKTTLAATVAELLDGATIVPGDDFYRPMPEHERERLSPQQGYHRYFDWERLRDHVLAPLRAEQTARYQSFDWATGQLGAWHEINPGTVVIVEGVYSVRPELAPYYHLTTYVDTPREICLQRMRARGQNPEEWITRWRAAEDYYLQTTWPQSRVHLLVRGH
jgi:uridine kinase